MKNFFRIARALKKRQKPVYLIFFVTARCNAKCRHCFYWKNTEAASVGAELSAEEIGRICRSVGQLLQVSISGGEPFLRADLQDICREVCTHSNPLLLTIPTNGLLPEKIARDMAVIAEQNPATHFRISLSLDALGEEHDFIRQSKGSFERVVKTYGLLAELRSSHSNLSVDFCTVLSSYNLKNVREIFEFVAREFAADNHLLTLLRGNPRDAAAMVDATDVYEGMLAYIAAAGNMGERNKPFHRFLYAVYEESLSTIAETARQKRRCVSCVAGSRMVEISETGEVFPCELLARPMGNVRDHGYDLHRLLSSPQALAVERYVKTGACSCTFECAVNASIIFDVKRYPRLLKRMLGKKFGVSRSSGK